MMARFVVPLHRALTLVACLIFICFSVSKSDLDLLCL